MWLYREWSRIECGSLLVVIKYPFCKFSILCQELIFTLSSNAFVLRIVLLNNSPTYLSVFLDLILSIWVLADSG